MLVIDSPPPTQQLLIYPSSSFRFSPDYPRLISSNVVHHADTALEVSISRYILVVSTRRAVVREAQPLPIPEMHIQKPLVSPIKAYTSLCQCQECVVIPHVGFQREDAAVETVWPSYIWNSCKCGRSTEELIWCLECHNIGIYVEYVGELYLSP